MRALIFCASCLIACDRSSPPAASLRAIDPPATAGAIAPNIVATDSGLLATWIERVESNHHRVRFAAYTRGTWQTAATIVEADNIVANWADVPSVAEQGDGTLIAHWAQKSAGDPYAYDVMLARSTAHGATWQPLGRAPRDATPAEHGFVSLLADARSTTAIWLDGRETGKGGPTMLRAATIASGVEQETIVDDRVCDCCSTAAAMTDSGPIVVYRDRTADELRDVWVARLLDGTWASHPVHRDGWKITGCPVNGPAVAARGRDVVVAWFTYADSIARIRVAFSRDAGASFAAPIDVDAPRGTRAPAGRVDVVLDGTQAIVSWLVSDREAGIVLLRRVSADGRLGPEYEVARTKAGRDSGFPRLTRAADDLVIMWTEPSEPSRLRAARLAVSAVPPATMQPPGASQKPATVAIGTAPEYSASTLTGAAVALRSLRGSPVLLNIWATWCEPCRHELPILDDVRARYEQRGLRVVAINVDREQPRDEIGAFIARRKLAFDIWVDPDDAASRVFSVATLPVTLLFDANGVLVWRRDGAIRDDDRELEDALARVLPPSR